MDSIRKCSRCGSNGHNSRTCNGKELKLFGVRIWTVEEEEETMKKSSSMVNSGSSTVEQGESGDNADGSSSDGLVRGLGRRERKRGRVKNRLNRFLRFIPVRKPQPISEVDRTGRFTVDPVRSGFVNTGFI
ncbi:hypothetical protein ACLOJK_027302 [Asimina triloba]